MKNIVVLMAMVIGITFFAGCAPKGYTQADLGEVLVPYEGVVVSARAVKVEDSGAGAVLGGIIGAVVGHQIGGGSGRDVATVAGAITGAVIGDKLAHANAQELVIELDTGRKIATVVAIDPKRPFWFRPGDRVRLYLRGDRVVRIEPIFLRDE